MKIKNKPLVIANWKMNFSKNDAVEFSKKLAQCSELGSDVVLCPPYIFLDAVLQEKSNNFKVGAQNCSYHTHDFGAYTGEISAYMLHTLGCEYVLIGHSERRKHHNDVDTIIALKIKNAHKAGMKVVLCVGESQHDKDNNRTKTAIMEQMSVLSDSCNGENLIIAYEPVWAIGTGLSASLKEIRDTHAFIKDVLKEKIKVFENKNKILYGGSVSQDNALDVMSIENVDGVLVGGVSLIFERFYQIIK